ncbi:hypothetical protein Angca_003836, partial [Angiostrongylus cantonensis]
RRSSRYHQFSGEGNGGESTVRTRFREVRSGDSGLEHREGLGLPNELDNDELKETVEANTRRTVREFVEPLSVSTETISTPSNRIGKTK